MTKIRLDEYLLQKGLVTDIAIARSLIIQGKVHNKHEKLIKSGIKVNRHDPDIKVKLPQHNYVSRGALKLITALDYFKIDPQNLVCIDIGSSTGGFTEVLFERKAELIFAVDVGYGELHSKLRFNPQIKVLEKTNARYLTDKQITTKPDLIVCDASFISLTTILPTPLNLAKEDCILIALIKPQFEVKKNEVENGGIITNPLLHQKVCDKIKNWLEQEHHFQIFGIIASPILGTKGNKEFLICGKRNMPISL
ncbi:TlyA family rRNA (cytidine-2'-O)-methyltransferase [Rickettsia prowazekii]|uniref:HEMOLYSIN (TlyA) n=2 Tax=Rickettsia prowazekii TaxID=782 RepID=Q9ZCZ5_RICPR|nr:TlyA family rRNA (cytidine-2'-O)-methyltransferase [Rickettsia prowazekii]EOB09927.1 Ribosome maturation factor RimP [Rickettsia prowazekii str. GvF12]ADE30089.1 Hemolysin A [Rickettsia prowazekii str. Rp22]AFE49358.1 hemolysin (tlyA) [Rickettsia prowazekii str. Chernikova]AFE50202.1 hemolysin (tlyA) [Rickettsia prowazekii str. Katsinyian]AFE51048.1 hemolysin (tlyA) [Rickettsia prowazekii str. BuV67-CWPP]